MFISEHFRSSLGFLDAKSVKSLGELEYSEDGTDFYRLPIAFMLHAYYEGSEEWIHPEYFTVKRNSDLMEIVTHSSRRIYIRQGDAITAVDNGLNFTKQLPKIGLCLPRYQLGWQSSIQASKLSVPFLKKSESKYVWTGAIKMDQDIGWLISVYVGDGWTDYLKGINTVNLANRNKDIVGEVKRIINSVSIGENIHFRIQGSKHKFNKRPSYSEKIIFSSRSWAEFFSQNIGHGAKNKHLPQWWQVAGENFRWGLLSGLIDSDGSIGLNRTRLKPSPQVLVKYDTISEILAHEVVELGHSLGLVGTIGYVKTPQGNDAYVVFFNKDSIAIMSQKLRLKTRKYIDILDGFKIGSKRNCHIYTLVILKDRLNELRHDVGIIDLFQNKDKLREIKPAELEKIKNRNRLYHAISRVFKGRDGCRGALIRDTAIEITKLDLNIFKSDDFWRRWKDLTLNREFGWEIITDVKPVKERGISYGFILPEGYSVITGSGLLI